MGAVVTKNICCCLDELLMFVTYLRVFFAHGCECPQFSNLAVDHCLNDAIMLKVDGKLLVYPAGDGWLAHGRNFLLGLAKFVMHLPHALAATWDEGC